MPPIAPLEHDYTQDEPLKEAFPDEQSHPLYHERPAMSYLYSYNPVKDHQLDIAKVLSPESSPANCVFLTTYLLVRTSPRPLK
jgi:hypothetical protein